MKKKIAFAAAMMMTALSLPIGSASAEEASFAVGDVDMDGIITGHDAAIVSKYADGVLELELSDEQLALADVNGDGIIDASDAAAIAENQKYSLFEFDGDESSIGILDGREILRMAAIRAVSPYMNLGQDTVRADVDCNGVIDVYDAFCVLDYHSKTLFTENSGFEDGKYYYVLTPEREKELLADQQDLIQHIDPNANAETLQDYFEIVILPQLDDMLDVDGDGELTLSDINVALSKYASVMARIDSSSENDPCDINGDGVVDIIDASFIQKVYGMRMACVL